MGRPIDALNDGDSPKKGRRERGRARWSKRDALLVNSLSDGAIAHLKRAYGYSSCESLILLDAFHSNDCDCRLSARTASPVSSLSLETPLLSPSDVHHMHICLEASYLSPRRHSLERTRTRQRSRDCHHSFDPLLLQQSQSAILFIRLLVGTFCTWAASRSFLWMMWKMLMRCRIPTLCWRAWQDRPYWYVVLKGCMWSSFAMIVCAALD